MVSYYEIKCLGTMLIATVALKVFIIMHSSLNKHIDRHSSTYIIYAPVLFVYMLIQLWYDLRNPQDCERY